MVPATTLSGCL